jgi:hypothetical protein
MPRLAPNLFYRARAIDPLLPYLLPACRDLETARYVPVAGQFVGVSASFVLTH